MACSCCSECLPLLWNSLTWHCACTDQQVLTALFNVPNLPDMYCVSLTGRQAAQSDHPDARLHGGPGFCHTSIHHVRPTNIWKLSRTPWISIVTRDVNLKSAVRALDVTYKETNRPCKVLQKAPLPLKYYLHPKCLTCNFHIPDCDYKSAVRYEATGPHRAYTKLRGVSASTGSDPKCSFKQAYAVQIILHTLAHNTLYIKDLDTSELPNTDLGVPEKAHYYFTTNRFGSHDEADASKLPLQDAVTSTLTMLLTVSLAP